MKLGQSIKYDIPINDLYDSFNNGGMEHMKVGILIYGVQWVVYVFNSGPAICHNGEHSWYK